MKSSTFALPVLLVSTACVALTPGTAPSHYTLRDVDTGPRFIACSNYVPPAGGRRMYRAEVIFDVTADGAVTNPQGRDTSATRLYSVARIAERVARSCRYRPALRDGQPVAVTGVKKSFAFEAAGRL